MLKAIKKMLYIDFFTFGIFSFLFLFANYFFPEKVTVKDLWLLMYVLFIMSFFGLIVFKEGVGSKSLWIRRGIMIGISCPVITLLMYLFHFIKFNYENHFEPPKVIPLEYIFHIIKAQQIWGFACKFLICDVIATTIAYIIADIIEKKNLQKINEKLKQNIVE